jgi:FAD/FMN-containing dehydrogenase
MLRLTLRALPLALLLAVLAGCDDDPTTPVSPTPDPITETFSGNLNTNGGATHTFTATTTGSMSATLTTVAPDSATVMGFAIGTWNGTACSHLIAKDDATQTSVLFGTVTSPAASLCVRVYDIGRFTGPVSYTITVVHP